jgi:PKD repeat protein
MKNRVALTVFIVNLLMIPHCTKGPKPDAVFTMDHNTVLACDTVVFTNLSTDATSYTWDFGDDSSSMEENPTHVYVKAGSYEVTLTVKGIGGTNTSKQTVTVLPSLTGYWTIGYVLSSAALNGSMNLIQQPDNSLTGKCEMFEYSDYGTTTILPSSVINGMSVSLNFIYNSSNYSIRGTVNTTHDFIDGSLFVGERFLFNCYSIKTMTPSH